MCLTIPKQVISVNKNIVKLMPATRSSTPLKELNSSMRATEIATTIIPVKKGDWVLTQNIVRHGSTQSVIIKKIKKEEAKEILALWGSAKK